MADFSNGLVSMDKSAIRRALARISHEIVEGNTDLSKLVLIGVELRGVYLAKRIANNIALFEGEDNRPSSLSLDVSGFRDDHSSKKTERVVPDIDVVGKDVILVDDVLYTGRTTRAAIDAVISAGRPKGIKLAVLVDRGHRELPIRPDYVGKNLPSSGGERIQVLLSESDGFDKVVRLVA